MLTSGLSFFSFFAFSWPMAWRRKEVESQVNIDHGSWTLIPRLHAVNKMLRFLGSILSAWPLGINGPVVVSLSSSRSPLMALTAWATKKMKKATSLS